MDQFDMNTFNMLLSQNWSQFQVKFEAISDKLAITENRTKKRQQPKTAFPENTPIGMSYVPYQMWEKPYDDAVGFVRGTIFPSLDKPFIGEEAVKNER